MSMTTATTIHMANTRVQHLATAALWRERINQLDRIDHGLTPPPDEVRAWINERRAHYFDLETTALKAAAKATT